MSTTAAGFYSCDDHLDLWNLPGDLWKDRLPAKLRERAPLVVEKDGTSLWMCDGGVMGPYRILSSYSAIRRAGIEDDGSRASNASACPRIHSTTGRSSAGTSRNARARSASSG